MSTHTLKLAVPRPLRQQVVEILRNAITECVFVPGGRLIERDLCERLGVSRTTLREGLRQLEAEGLLELAPNKGPVVPSLDYREAADVYAIRGELEGYACALCADRATKADLEALRNSLESMIRAERRGDFEELQRVKTDFYERLCDGAGNSELKHTLRRLRARVTLIRGLNVNRAARVKESVDGARAIYQAVASRDPVAARRAATRHLARAAELAIEAMRSPDRPLGS